MIEKICNTLTNRIRKEMPEIDEERAEVINYGLQLVVGEVPKIFLIFIISYILGVFELTLLSILLIIPYRIVSGGTHLHSHIGCLIATSIFYIGNAIISQFLVWNNIVVKYISVFVIWVFSMIMIKKYAPADTQDVPILRKKEREIKQKLSFLIMTISLSVGLVIKNNTISNLLIVGTFMQSITITKFMYKLTKNRFGYLEYIKMENSQTSN